MGNWLRSFSGTCAVLAMLNQGCSGNGLELQTHSTSGDAPSAAEREPTQQTAAEVATGELLARVSVTPSHNVEFWQSRQGDVLMVQTFDTTVGDQSLELGPMLLSAGGSLAGLYRVLLKDASASIPPELSSADEHRRHLPIRDASVPVTSAVIPTSGVTGTASKAEIEATDPGTLHSLSFKHSGGGVDTGFSSTDFCGQSLTVGTYTDGGWCPPGAYNSFVTGNTQETMYWESVGHNAQPSGGALATFVVRQYWSNGSFTTAFSYGLAPNHTVQATAIGTGATYQGRITGTTVAFAERWRLSFPSLTYLEVSPHWNSANAFTNDLNGITHKSAEWIMSRTIESSGGNPVYGCLASLGDLGRYPGNPCPAGEIQAWRNLGYNHYGDLVWDPATNKYYVSMTQSGNLHGSVGVFDSTATPIGIAEVNPGGGCSWIAVNPKNRAFYFSSGVALSQRSIWVLGSTVLSTDLPDIQLVNLAATPNGEIEDIEGGKVSSHGKLWVNSFHTDLATGDRGGVIYGIDPYSGIIQVAQTLVFNWPQKNAFGHDTEEAEGLDITDDSFTLPIPGQIHVQNLRNNVLTSDFTSDDSWELVHYQVSDMSRL